MTRQSRALAAAALATAALTSALSGCGADHADGEGGGEPDALGPLANSSYLSTGVTQDGHAYPLVDGTRISLRFWDSRLSAQAGCNTLGADATLDGEAIQLRNGLSMTEMGCARRLMRQDDWLADLLGGSPVATLDDDRLTLTSGDGGTVVDFVNGESANPDRPLTETTWTLETLGGSADDASSASVPSGVMSTLTIGDDGRVSIRPGCNTGGGQATVESNVIDFGPIALTRMACPSAEMETESFVMKVVDGAVHYTVDADTLTLTKDGYTLIYVAR
jgi:heat shock protein HslJ